MAARYCQCTIGSTGLRGLALEWHPVNVEEARSLVVAVLALFRQLPPLGSLHAHQAIKHACEASPGYSGQGIVSPPSRPANSYAYATLLRATSVSGCPNETHRLRLMCSTPRVSLGSAGAVARELIA